MGLLNLTESKSIKPINFGDIPSFEILDQLCKWLATKMSTDGSAPLLTLSSLPISSSSSSASSLGVVVFKLGSACTPLWTCSRCCPRFRVLCLDRSVNKWIMKEQDIPLRVEQTHGGTAHRYSLSRPLYIPYCECYLGRQQ